MKILIAPDSFKETLSAALVARALEKGVRSVVPDAVIDCCPMADGGEGTVDAMVNATGGTFETAIVSGPLGRPVKARFGLLGQLGGDPTLPPHLRSEGRGVRSEKGRLKGFRLKAEGTTGFPYLQPSAFSLQPKPRPPSHPPTAVIEMAAASGLELVAPDQRNPLLTTTYGTGELIRAALDAGASEILIGIGGSATVDGGCGCAQALGVVFRHAQSQATVHYPLSTIHQPLSGGGLMSIVEIDVSGLDPRLRQVPIRVACDVTNPLTGPQGAAAIFGPQKGATPEMIAQLDAGLAHLAEIIRRRLGLDVERIPGAGAAGGLGAGLVAFAGARLEPGLEIVAEAVGLANRLRGADLCITGEGRLDGSSSMGKTAVGVSRFASDAGVPVICIPGQAAANAPFDRFAAVYALVGDDVTLQQAMSQPAEILSRRAAEAVRHFITGDTRTSH